MNKEGANRNRYSGQHNGAARVGTCERDLFDQRHVEVSGTTTIHDCVAKHVEKATHRGLPEGVVMCKWLSIKDLIT